jgi:hypothetical protein
MSFGHPYLLLVPARRAAGDRGSSCSPSAGGCATPSRSRTSTCSRRSRAGARLRRFVPAALFLLALAAFCVALARPAPQHAGRLRPGDDHSRHRRLGLDARDGREADAARRGAGGRPHVPRARAEARARRPDRVLERAAGRRAADDEPRPSPRVTRRARLLPGYGGTAIGDALAAAVELGKQAVPGGAGRRSPHGREAEQPALDPLPLRREADPRHLLPAPGRAACEGGGDPVYTVALGTPHGVLTRPPGGGFFGSGGGGEAAGSSGASPFRRTRRRSGRSPDTTGGKFFAARSAGRGAVGYEELGLASSAACRHAPRSPTSSSRSRRSCSSRGHPLAACSGRARRAFAPLRAAIAFTAIAGCMNIQR